MQTDRLYEGGERAPPPSRMFSDSLAFCPLGLRGFFKLPVDASRTNTVFAELLRALKDTFWPHVHHLRRLSSLSLTHCWASEETLRKWAAQRALSLKPVISYSCDQTAPSYQPPRLPAAFTPCLVYWFNLPILFVIYDQGFSTFPLSWGHPKTETEGK